MVEKNGRRASDIKQDKRKEAETRVLARANRSIDQQLERLRQRPGLSKREVTRLTALKDVPVVTHINTPNVLSYTDALVEGIPVGEMVVTVAKPRKAKERKAKEKKARPGHQE
jgi:hypothetical protein